METHQQKEQQQIPTGDRLSFNPNFQEGQF